MKSIDSHDRLIFVAIQSPHKIPQNSVLLLFYQFIALILDLFDATRNIAIHIVYRFKVLMI